MPTVACGFGGTADGRQGQGKYLQRNAQSPLLSSQCRSFLVSLDGNSPFVFLMITMPESEAGRSQDEPAGATDTSMAGERRVTVGQFRTLTVFNSKPNQKWTKNCIFQRLEVLVLVNGTLILVPPIPPLFLFEIFIKVVLSKPVDVTQSAKMTAAKMTKRSGNAGEGSKAGNEERR